MFLKVKLNHLVQVVLAHYSNVPFGCRTEEKLKLDALVEKVWHPVGIFLLLLLADFCVRI